MEVNDSKSAEVLKRIESNGFSIEFDADSLKKIKLNFTNMDMEISSHTGKSIIFIGESEAAIARDFKIKSDGNELQIKDRKKLDLIGYIAHKRQRGRLILPKRFEGSLEIKVTNSDLIISKSNIERIKISATANTLHLENVMTDYLEVSATAYNMEIVTSALGTVKLSTTACTMVFKDVDATTLNKSTTSCEINAVGGTLETLFSDLKTHGRYSKVGQEKQDTLPKSERWSDF